MNDPASLRARSIPELLDASVRLYRDNFGNFLGIAALTQVPLGLLGVALGAVFYRGIAPTLGSTLVEADRLRGTAEVLGVAAGVVVLGIVSLIVTSLTLAALIYSLNARLSGDRPGVLECYRESLGRGGVLILTRLLFFVLLALLYLPGAVVLGIGAAMLSSSGVGGNAAGGLLIALGSLLALLAFVAMVYLWIRWYLQSQTCVLEDQSPVGALRRSWRVSVARWWRTLGFVILLSLFVSAVSATPSSIASFLGVVFSLSPGGADVWAQVLSNSVSTLASVLLMPVNLAAATLLYFDHRVRREGLDVELAADQLWREAQAE